MANKYLDEINADGIADLLSEFAEAQVLEEFTEEEHKGVIKFIVHLIEKWGVDYYIN